MLKGSPETPSENFPDVIGEEEDECGKEALPVRTSLERERAVGIINTRVKFWVAKQVPEGKEFQKEQLPALVEFLKNDPATRRELEKITHHFGNRDLYIDRPAVKLDPEGVPGMPSIWLLGWRPGEITELHDHGKSEAAITTLHGAITEKRYVPPPGLDNGITQLLNSPAGADGVPATVLERTIEEGDATVSIPAPYVHTVEHGGTAPVSASIHAYYPRLIHMGHLQFEDGVLTKKESSWNEE